MVASQIRGRVTKQTNILCEIVPVYPYIKLFIFVLYFLYSDIYSLKI